MIPQVWISKPNLLLSLLVQHYMAGLGEVPRTIFDTYRGWTSIDMCKQKRSKNISWGCGEACVLGISALWGRFPFNFALTSHQKLAGLFPPTTSHASVLGQHPAPRQSSWVTCSWLSLAEQRGSLHCSQKKHHLQGLKLLQTAQPQPCTSVPSLPCTQTLLLCPIYWGH